MSVHYVGEPGEGDRSMWEAVARVERALNPRAVVTVVLPADDDVAPLLDRQPAALVDDERFDAVA